MGPRRALGMLSIPLITLTAALIARRDGAVPARRALLVAGLGITGALTAHGLTDQVVTTNVGTGLLLFGLAAVIASLMPAARAHLAGCVRWAMVCVAAAAALVILAVLATPAGRAQVLLNLGG